MAILPTLAPLTTAQKHSTRFDKKKSGANKTHRWRDFRRLGNTPAARKARAEYMEKVAAEPEVTDAERATWNLDIFLDITEPDTDVSEFENLRADAAKDLEFD